VAGIGEPPALPVKARGSQQASQRRESMIGLAATSA